MSEDARFWKVIGGRDLGGIKVRERQETSSGECDSRLSFGAVVKEKAVAGNRLHYDRVSGTGPRSGWVSIKFEGRHLVERTDAPQQPDPEDEEYVFIEEATMTPAEDVLSQLEAELARGSTAVMPAGSDETSFLPVNLAESKPPEDNRYLDFFSKAREWLRRFNPNVRVPAHVRLPAAAVHWEPAAAVLYVLTHGHFDPARDVREVGTANEPGSLPEGGEPRLVSVVCATSDRRRSFHPLLYENFRRQSHEPRELVIVHTGELPSEFFMQRAEEDPRVIYRFFPVTREAPGSPRLSDEQMGSPWASCLKDDDPEELVHWGPGDPWKWEIQREGWTKGLKRNVACCIARGSSIVHFDEGCLYSFEYLRSMAGKLASETQKVSSGANKSAAAITLNTFYTVGISDEEFRSVDLTKPEPLWEQYGMNPRTAQMDDQYNHGFVYAYTRSAWEQHPFPERETCGTQDSEFMKALKETGISVSVLRAGQEAAAACGWHRDATSGAKDACSSINSSQVLSHFMFRGEEVLMKPRAFDSYMPLMKEVAQDLLTKRESYLKELVGDHGKVHVCAQCNFAVALDTQLKSVAKTITTSMQATDAYAYTLTYDKFQMKFDISEFSNAGGAVAEGHWHNIPGGTPWLSGQAQRMAICRNCGWQLGWRYEPAGAPKECASAGCGFLVTTDRSRNRHKDYCCSRCAERGPYEEHAKDCEQVKAPKPKGPVFWGFIKRHLRERSRPGETVPKESDKTGPRHKETSLNAGQQNVCPDGHKLQHFCTGQGNGGAPPLYYICDICDTPARGAQHMWGCGTCDYDLCERCKGKRR